MGMIEVDLLDSDGVIVSVAQVDANVWPSLAAQTTQAAAQRGFGIDTGTLFNSPERTLASFGDVQNWLASQSDASAKAPLAQSQPAQAQGMSTGETVAIVVGGLSLAVLVALAVRAAMQR